MYDEDGEASGGKRPEGAGVPCVSHAPHLPTPAPPSPSPSVRPLARCVKPNLYDEDGEASGGKRPEGAGVLLSSPSKCCLSSAASSLVCSVCLVVAFSISY
ncbi:MAG: hypothetical protein ACKERG_00110 [Candidatus Hodgkinia cicadicola]